MTYVYQLRAMATKKKEIIVKECAFGCVEKASDLNKHHVCVVLKISVMVVVFTVCGLKAAGVSSLLYTGIGMAAVSVIILALLGLALTTNLFDQADNRSTQNPSATIQKKMKRNFSLRWLPSHPLRNTAKPLLHCQATLKQ